MQRQVWKENIKFDDKKKEEEKKKKDKEKKNVYDPVSYPFGAEDLLLDSELKKMENEER